MPEVMEKKKSRHVNKFLASRAGVWPSETLTYVKFTMPQKFQSQNTHLSFWRNESIEQALVYKDDCVKLTLKCIIKKSKAVPLHAMVAPGGRGGIASTHT
jgi:hypothetical protein